MLVKLNVSRTYAEEMTVTARAGDGWAAQYI
jgi:hypothetical protein